MRDVTFCTDAFGSPEHLGYSERFLACLLWALVFADESYLLSHPNTPPLYKWGVRWRREEPTYKSPCKGGLGQEQFLGIQQIREQGFADCEDLACARVAEVRLGRGMRRGLAPRAGHPKVTACPVPYPMKPIGPNVVPGFFKRRTPQGWLYHIVVCYPNGQVEDPSRVLGMGGEG